MGGRVRETMNAVVGRMMMMEQSGDEIVGNEVPHRL